MKRLLVLSATNCARQGTVSVEQIHMPCCFVLDMYAHHRPTGQCTEMAQVQFGPFHFTMGSLRKTTEPMLNSKLFALKIFRIKN